MYPGRGWRDQLLARVLVGAALRMKPGLSDRSIAEHVGVSHQTVANYRNSLSKIDSRPGERTGRDGSEKGSEMLLLRIAQVLVACLAVAFVCLVLYDRRRRSEMPPETDWKFVRLAFLFIGAVVLVVAFLWWVAP
jgi:hypothetical protein